MFYIYILKSESSLHFYKGFTSNPIARLYEHNAGFTRHTKGKGPWVMIFLQQFELKSDALIQVKGIQLEINSADIRNRYSRQTQTD